MEPPKLTMLVISDIRCFLFSIPHPPPPLGPPKQTMFGEPPFGGRLFGRSFGLFPRKYCMSRIRICLTHHPLKMTSFQLGPSQEGNGAIPKMMTPSGHKIAGGKYGAFAPYAFPGGGWGQTRRSLAQDEHHCHPALHCHMVSDSTCSCQGAGRGNGSYRSSCLGLIFLG